jgi:GDP-L-fucose synthase
MKLLVTGVDGLIGSAIKHLNPPNAVFLERKDIDLTNFSKTLEVFKKHRPTHLIHAAAVVGGIKRNREQPATLLRENTLINLNTLEAARLVGVEKLVSFLSTCSFPEAVTFPYNEKDFHNGPPYEGTAGYAYAKRMLEALTRGYRKEYGCNFVTVIGTNFYGPNDNFSLEDGHVLPALIHKCYLAKKNNTDLQVWGSGRALREFVLSDDVANLALWALENYNEDTPIILTSGVEVSIKDLVNLVVQKMEFKGRVFFDDSKPDGQLRRPSDTTKLKSYLPDFKFTNLAEGIEKTVTWFLGHYPNIRK